MTSASFRFVCQDGGLDYKSAFLAASLRHFVTFPYELIACVPDNNPGDAPAADVLGFVETICDRVVSIRNPLPVDYPIGNKLAALNEATEQDVRIFLDSDILCLRAMDRIPLPSACELAAKLEDWDHHSPEEWTELHDHFDLGPPRRDHLSTVFREPMPLYLNCGFLCLANGSDLAARWIETAWEIENHLRLPRQRPNLDQLAMAALLLKDGVKVHLLDENWNYPAELRPLKASRLPILCHYHDPVHIVAEAALAGTISRLARAFPALRDIALKSNQWFWKAPALASPVPLHV